MKTLSDIQNLLPNLSSSQQKIGRYLLHNPKLVNQLSSSELAKNIGVSQSAIVKFSQRIGYKGFSDLKAQIYQHNHTYQGLSQKAIHGSIRRNDNSLALMKKLELSKEKTLSNTSNSNQTETLEDAVQMLSFANKIQISGVGSSSLVAKDLSYKLMKIGCSVHYAEDTHIQMANASALTSADVLIAISHSGRSREVLNIVDIAKKSQAKIIIISRFLPTPLDIFADIKLISVGDEEYIRSSSITVRDSQLFITDMLFIGLTQRQENADLLIEKSKMAVSLFKI